MKKFLIISGSFLVGAIIATILVFWYVSTQLSSVDQSSLVPSSDGDGAASSAEVVSEESTVPPEGIPLSSLPLSDGQKSTLETMGVDVETFVITPAMQLCAEEKLGAARMEEIINGAEPGFLEATKLISCTSVE